MLHDILSFFQLMRILLLTFVVCHSSELASNICASRGSMGCMGMEGFLVESSVEG